MFVDFKFCDASEHITYLSPSTPLLVASPRSAKNGVIADSVSAHRCRRNRTRETKTFQVGIKGSIPLVRAIDVP